MSTLPYVSQALANNGTVDGVLEVASTSALGVGATVFLRSATKPTVELVINEILTATTFNVKLKTPYVYTMFDASGYLVVDTATVVQPAQLNVNRDDYKEPGSVDLQDEGVSQAQVASLSVVGPNISANASGEITFAPGTSRHHTVIIYPSGASSSPGKTPTPIVFDTVLGLDFTVGSDDAFRLYRIPASYAGNAKIHIHWTKTGDADESGKNVKWLISYKVFNGSSDEITAPPSTVEAEETYLDSGTTTRIVYESAELSLVGITASKYLSLKIEAVAPAGTALAGGPTLISVDLSYDKNNLADA